MTKVYVRTQEELDEALANPKYEYEWHEIVICSPKGVWLEIRDSHGKDVYVSSEAKVEVSGDASVKAVENATVNAWGRASVRAWNRATVRAWNRATVRAWNRATVKAFGDVKVKAFDTVTVEAFGNSIVTVRDNATVNALEQATIDAFGNATVNACGYATVSAWDRASVRAWNRATVDAWEDSTVEAGIFVAVYVHSKTVAHEGRVIIDVTLIDANDPGTWCAMHLVEVDEDGQAHLYKALDADLNAGHDYRLTHYPIGHVVDDSANWVDDNRCGNGLHVSPTPWLAKTYYEEGSRFVEVCCPVKELRPIDSSKAKAPRLRVLREVTVDGSSIGGETR